MNIREAVEQLDPQNQHTFTEDFVRNLVDKNEFLPTLFITTLCDGDIDNVIVPLPMSICDTSAEEIMSDLGAVCHSLNSEPICLTFACTCRTRQREHEEQECPPVDESWGLQMVIKTLSVDGRTLCTAAATNGNTTKDITSVEDYRSIEVVPDGLMECFYKGYLAARQGQTDKEVRVDLHEGYTEANIMDIDIPGLIKKAKVSVGPSESDMMKRTRPSQN